MASSLPPNGLPSANAVHAHAQANDILQKDAARGKVAVHSFHPDASPAEKAAVAGQARTQLSSTITPGTGDTNDGALGIPLPYRACMTVLSLLIRPPLFRGRHRHW
jgi:hypothetical protein